MKKIASFTYYGSSPDKNRDVTLSVDNFPPSYRDIYAVTVEGYPGLTKHTPNRDEAEEILRGWWEMSQKDWGASEIEWRSD